MGRLIEHPAMLIVLLVIVLLLFGGKRLPELASGIGQSLRIFKREVNGLHDDDKTAEQASAPQTTAQQTAATPPQATVPVEVPAPTTPAQAEHHPSDPSA